MVLVVMMLLGLCSHKLCRLVHPHPNEAAGCVLNYELFRFSECSQCPAKRHVGSLSTQIPGHKRQLASGAKQGTQTVSFPGLGRKEPWTSSKYRATGNQAVSSFASICDFSVILSWLRQIHAKLDTCVSWSSRPSLCSTLQTRCAASSRFLVFGVWVQRNIPSNRSASAQGA